MKEKSPISFNCCYLYLFLPFFIMMIMISSKHTKNSMLSTGIALFFLVSFVPFIQVVDSLALTPPVSSSGGLASDETFDVILSSGFLCFSRHSGFLAALEQSSLSDRVDRYIGTSSGALAAAMAASGMTAPEVARELSSKRPISECRLSAKFWRGGILSTRALQRRLEKMLPPTFEDLKKPLAVGVYDVKTMETKLITSGPLIPAVAASCAVPGGMFVPVKLPQHNGRYHADGGKLDRTFVKKWREWNDSDDQSSSVQAKSMEQKRRKVLIHLITSNPPGTYKERDGIPSDFSGDLTIIHSPRTEGGLFSLGDFDAEVASTQQDTITQLRHFQVL